MTTLKLPFELEKPSSNEYVTQASEIGYGEGSTKDVLDVSHQLITGSYDWVIGKSINGFGQETSNSNAAHSSYIVNNPNTIYSFADLGNFSHVYLCRIKNDGTFSRTEISNTSFSLSTVWVSFCVLVVSDSEISSISSVIGNVKSIYANIDDIKKELQQDVEDVKIATDAISYNINSQTQWVIGEGISGEGSVTENANASHTVKIPVDASAIYTFEDIGNYNSVYVCKYASNGDFLRGKLQSASFSITNKWEYFAILVVSESAIESMSSNVMCSTSVQQQIEDARTDIQNLNDSIDSVKCDIFGSYEWVIGKSIAVNGVEQSNTKAAHTSVIPIVTGNIYTFEDLSEYNSVYLCRNKKDGTFSRVELQNTTFSFSDIWESFSLLVASANDIVSVTSEIKGIKSITNDLEAMQESVEDARSEAETLSIKVEGEGFIHNLNLEDFERVQGFFINGTGTNFHTQSNAVLYAIPIEDDWRFLNIGSSDGTDGRLEVMYEFVSEFDSSNIADGSPTHGTGGGRIKVTAGTTDVVRLTSTATHLLVQTYYYGDRTPAVLGVELSKPNLSIEEQVLKDITCLNGAYTWWTSPHMSRRRQNGKDITIIGYVKRTGFLTIGVRDNLNSSYKEVELMDSTQVDDHNGLAVFFLDDGRIVVITAQGHNASPNEFVYVSKIPMSIDEGFNEPVVIQTTGYTTYSTIIRKGNRTFLFYRNAPKNQQTGDFYDVSWSMFYSDSADLSIWSQQYNVVATNYVYFADTTDEHWIKIVPYAHPRSGGDIRCGYLNVDTLKIYDHDHTTEITWDGTTPIPNTSFTSLIPTIDTEGSRHRLLYVPITGLDKDVILYGKYSSFDSETGFGPCTYYLYDNGQKHFIAPTGRFYHQSSGYISGGLICEDKQDVIIIGREQNGKYYLEKYKYDGTNITRESIIAISNDKILRAIYCDCQLAWLDGEYLEIDSFGAFNLNIPIIDIVL